MTTTANCVFSAWFLLHVFVPLMSWGGQRKQIGTLLFSVGFPFDIMHKEISLIHVWHTDSYQRRRLPIALLPRSTSDETPQYASRKKKTKNPIWKWYHTGCDHVQLSLWWRDFSWFSVCCWSHFRLKHVWRRNCRNCSFFHLSLENVLCIMTVATDTGCVSIEKHFEIFVNLVLAMHSFCFISRYNVRY